MSSLTGNNPIVIPIPDPFPDLTEADRADIASFKQNSSLTSSALVLGGTGETGKALIRELLLAEAFDKVVVITRKPVAYDGPNNDKLVNYIISDFEKLDEHAEAFLGHTHVFSCFGTTRAQAGSAERFRRIDHDYVLSMARLACINSKTCRVFSLVSASNANKNSFLLYSQVKGQTEDELASLLVPKENDSKPSITLLIYRPGYLRIPDEGRREPRFFDNVAETIFSFMSSDKPNKFQVHVNVLARSMRRHALRIPASTPSQQGEVIFYDNETICKDGRK